MMSMQDAEHNRLVTSAVDGSAIKSLVVVRLLAVGEKGEAASKIKKDLEPLLAHRWESAALSERIDRMLTALGTMGLVALVPGKTKKAVPKYVLTVEGRRDGLDFLGVEQLRPKTTWTILRKTYLPARVLKMPASSDARFKALSSEPTFQAVLLKRQYDLSTAEIPKPDEATDALAWKLIGFEGENRKFNPKNVKTALFNRAAGTPSATDFKKAATRLLAQRMGARRDDPKELRDALLRNWVDQEEGGTVPAGPTSTTSGPVLPSPSPAPALDLASFAQQVKSAARDCPTGRFGNNKVFIAHVWKALQADPVFRTMELAAFKEVLAEANNARLLDLSRADLVQAMDPDDVRESEVHYLNATFHFVRI
jgi:hypothetical protein